MAKDYIAYPNSYDNFPANDVKKWCGISQDINTEVIKLDGFGGNSDDEDKACYELLRNYNTRPEWNDKRTPQYSTKTNKPVSTDCRLISDQLPPGCSWPYSYNTPLYTLPKSGRWPYSNNKLNQTFNTFRISGLSENQCKEIVASGKRPVFRIRNQQNNYLSYVKQGDKLFVKGKKLVNNDTSFYWWFENYKVEEVDGKTNIYCTIWNYDENKVLKVGGEGYLNKDPAYQQMILIPYTENTKDNTWVFVPNSEGTTTGLIKTLYRVDKDNKPDFTLTITNDSDNHVVTAPIATNIYCGQKDSTCMLTIEATTVPIKTGNNIDISSGLYEYWDKGDGYKECMLFPGTDGKTIIPKEPIVTSDPVTVQNYITTPDNVINPVTGRFDLLQTLEKHYVDDKANNELDYVVLNRRISPSDMGKQVTFSNVESENNCYDIMKNEQSSDFWPMEGDTTNIPILAEYDTSNKTCKLFNIKQDAQNSTGAYIFGYKVDYGILGSQATPAGTASEVDTCLERSMGIGKNYPLVSKTVSECNFHDYDSPSNDKLNIKTIVDMQKIFEKYKNCALRDTDKVAQNDCTHWGALNFDKSHSIDEVMDAWCVSQATVGGKDINDLDNWPISCHCIAAKHIKDGNTIQLDEAWNKLSKAAQDKYGEEHKLCVIDECFHKAEKDGINYYRPREVIIDDGSGNEPCARSSCSINIKSIGGKFTGIGCGKGSELDARYKCVSDTCIQSPDSDGYSSLEECAKACDKTPDINTNTNIIIVVIFIILISLAIAAVWILPKIFMKPSPPLSTPR